MTGEYAFDGSNHGLGMLSVGKVSPSRDRVSSGAIVGVTTGDRPGPVYYAAVPADEVPDVARRLVQQMHEAAGLVPPIVLDRPECPAHSYELGDVKVCLTEAGLIHIDDDGCDDMPPYKARALAERLAHLADEAERGPSKAEVDTLAQIVRAHWLNGPPDDTFGFVASAILRAGYRPPAQGGEG